MAKSTAKVFGDRVRQSIIDIKREVLSASNLQDHSSDVIGPHLQNAQAAYGPQLQNAQAANHFDFIAPQSQNGEADIKNTRRFDGASNVDQRNRHFHGPSNVYQNSGRFDGVSNVDRRSGQFDGASNVDGASNIDRRSGQFDATANSTEPAPILEFGELLILCQVHNNSKHQGWGRSIEK